jgi:hypothetical protein
MIIVYPDCEELVFPVCARLMPNVHTTMPHKLWRVFTVNGKLEFQYAGLHTSQYGFCANDPRNDWGQFVCEYCVERMRAA